MHNNAQIKFRIHNTGEDDFVPITQIKCLSVAYKFFMGL